MSDGTPGATAAPEVLMCARPTMVHSIGRFLKGIRVSIPSSTPADFSGLWIPLVTPFDGGAVDHSALAALAKRLACDGIAGFVVCGSTGEAAALDAEEQLAVLNTVAQAAPALPRIMGVSGSHLGKMKAWIERLNDRSLAGLLLPAPSYVRPSQQGLLGWFGTLAEASEMPLLIYDIPYRTGATLSRDTLLALAAHPRIRGIKDCGGDMAKTRALIADGRLQVLAGEDAQMFGTMAEGGVGAIAASAHWKTPCFVELVRCLSQGRLAQARILWGALRPMIEALFLEPNPGPLKALLAHNGELQDQLRAPMTSASADLRDRLLALDAGFSRP